MAQTQLMEKAGSCCKGFDAAADRDAVKPLPFAIVPKAPVPEHLICPCYRPKR